MTTAILITGSIFGGNRDDMLLPSRSIISTRKSGIMRSIQGKNAVQTIKSFHKSKAVGLLPTYRSAGAKEV